MADDRTPPEEQPEETPAADEQAPVPAAEETPAAEEAPAAEATPAEATPVEAPAEATPVEAPGEAPSPQGDPVADAAGASAAPEAAASSDDEGLEEDFVDETPRVKPEIPGADLEVDIVEEGADPLLRGEGEGDEDATPGDSDEIADEPIAAVTIDLAAGARYRATGKRKTAIARVILIPGTGAYTINGRELDVFFPRATLQRTIRQPLKAVGYDTRMDVIARMHGGGVSAQAGALRHGISRALLEADPNLRGELKRRGFLTRDPRVKERKKAGLKKARKRPQFSKR